jgi:hypothetical protein
MNGFHYCDGDGMVWMGCSGGGGGAGRDFTST